MKLKDYKIGHYELWDWLSKNPNKYKCDWPGWKDYENTTINSNCFACEYSDEVDRGVAPNRCGYCPPDKKAIKKFKNEKFYSKDDCLAGLFDVWELENDSKLRKKYALMIRDLWGGNPEDKKSK